MSHTTTRFEYPIVYEDRDAIHTGRWKLQGVNTREHDANTDRGWLWMETTDASNTVTVNLYKDIACAADDKVATGTADISGIDDAEVKCTLTEANSSGLSGEFYFLDYDDDTTAIGILATLCVDRDLELLCRRGVLRDFPSDVYDPTYGMARWCAAATEKGLLMVSQLYQEELGGYGARETRHQSGAERDYPRYSVIAAPEQLRDAASHWALMLAHGACYGQSGDTADSVARDYHEEQKNAAVASWNLTFNTDPDADVDADTSAHVGAVPICRV